MLVAENCGPGSRVLFGLFGSGTPDAHHPGRPPVKTFRDTLGGRRGGCFGIN